MGSVAVHLVPLTLGIIVALAVRTTLHGRRGLWKFPLAIWLLIAFASLVAWAGLMTELDEIRYRGEESLIEEWQTEVDTHVREMASALFPGLPIEVVEDEWLINECYGAISDSISRRVVWHIILPPPWYISPAGSDNVEHWWRTAHPEYDLSPGIHGGGLSLDTPRGGVMYVRPTSLSADWPPTVSWFSPCAGTHTPWMWYVSWTGLIAAFIAAGAFTTLYWRNRFTRLERHPGSTPPPDFTALARRPLLGLHFPASDATQDIDILGQFVPVARTRQPLQWAINQFGYTMASGTIDGEPAEAVVTFVTRDMIQIALIPDGAWTTIAIQHGADYEAAWRVAAMIFDGKVRPIR